VFTSIEWGDGNRSTARGMTCGAGQFEEQGLIQTFHRYDKPGRYEIVIRLTDTAGDVVRLEKEVVLR
jgi:hypothetical protein